jgi:hypothetical protein
MFNDLQFDAPDEEDLDSQSSPLKGSQQRRRFGDDDGHDRTVRGRPDYSESSDEESDEELANDEIELPKRPPDDSRAEVSTEARVAEMMKLEDGADDYEEDAEESMAGIEIDDSTLDCVPTFIASESSFLKRH